MEDWDHLIRGLREGDEETMTAFVRRYRPALERIASGAISPGLQRRIGPESVAQSVCRTFLRRMGSDSFQLRDADSLWRLLCAIALTKVREKVRFHRRERRGVGREVPLDAAAGVASPGAPPPDEVAAFQEVFELALRELEAEERAVLELRLEGLTQPAIAEELGCSERTVRRLLTNLETRLRALLD